MLQVQHRDRARVGVGVGRELAVNTARGVHVPQRDVLHRVALGLEELPRADSRRRKDLEEAPAFHGPHTKEGEVKVKWGSPRVVRVARQE